jgi:hypothetical protein
MSDTKDWKLVDVAEMESWPPEKLEWLIEPIIMKGGIGFIAGPPKAMKSFLATDIALHLAIASTANEKQWLNRYKCNPARVLYIAREDPGHRIQARIKELCTGCGIQNISKGQIKFLVRERVNLLNPEHIKWFKKVVQENGFDVVILDVLDRMMPDVEGNSTKEMSPVISILEEINRGLKLTIIILDHTRKPTANRRQGRNEQALSPSDLKGTTSKYGLADYCILVSRTRQEGQIRLYAENKDHDEHIGILVSVSAKDSGDPKFVIAGDVAEFAQAKKLEASLNHDKILAAIGSDWISRKDIGRAVQLASSCLNRHLAELIRSGEVERTGENIKTRYRKPTSGKTAQRPVVKSSRNRPTSKPTLKKTASRAV